MTEKQIDAVPNRVDVESSITDDRMINNVDLNRLSKVNMTNEGIAYIIFTSDSTRISKAVSFGEVDFEHVLFLMFRLNFVIEILLNGVRVGNISSDDGK